MDAYIYDAARTPRGKNRGGSLHSVKPVDLAVTVIDAILERNPGLNAEQIDDVVLGVVSPVGEQGGDTARAAALVSGLPETVPGVQVNRFCASGLEAVNLAAQKVASGYEDLVLAGGVESMSRVPLSSDGGAYAQDPTTAYDQYFVPQGIGADLIATIEGLSREDVDGFAVRSQLRAEAAWQEGRFDKSIIPVKDINGLTLLDNDEHRRPDSTVESLGQLPASFARMGDEAGFDAVALQERMLFAEALDAIDCLETGVLDSVADANIGSIFGIGFPAWTGGVLQYVNQYEGGLQGFVGRANKLAATYGDRFTPPASLVERAKTGKQYL